MHRAILVDNAASRRAVLDILASSKRFVSVRKRAVTNQPDLRPTNVRGNLAAIAKSIGSDVEPRRWNPRRRPKLASIPYRICLNN